MVTWGDARWAVTLEMSCVRAPCHSLTPRECYATAAPHFSTGESDISADALARCLSSQQGWKCICHKCAHAADILHQIVRVCYCFDKARRREVNTALCCSMHLKFRQCGAGFFRIFSCDCLSLWIPLWYHVSFPRWKQKLPEHTFFFFTPFLRFVELKWGGPFATLKLTFFPSSKDSAAFKPNTLSVSSLALQRSPNAKCKYSQINGNEREAMQSSKTIPRPFSCSCLCRWWGGKCFSLRSYSRSNLKQGGLQAH